jgi:hypothetical protein
MKKILFLIFLSLTIKTNACTCLYQDFTEEYNNADFIAKVKIIEIKPIQNQSTVNVKIQIIELFKGKAISIFKIIDYKNLCSLNVVLNSTWLIYGQKSQNNEIQSYHCSGSEEFGIGVDINYPNIEKVYAEKIELKMAVLRKLKKYSQNKNPYELHTTLNQEKKYLIVDDLRVENKKFAIFELNINTDLSVKRIKTICEFDNKVASRILTDYIKSRIIIEVKTKKTIPKKTKIYLIYFFYNSEGENKSFLTSNIL